MAFIQLEATYLVVICTRCQIGINSPSPGLHLKNFHPELSLQQYQQYRDQIASYRAPLQTQIRLPTVAIPINPNLAYSLNGLQCSECPYICMGPTGMKKHYRTLHHWVNPYKKGGSLQSRKNHTYPWRVQVPCQRFFYQGDSSGYFKVLSNDPGSSNPMEIATRTQLPLNLTIQSQLSNFDQIADQTCSILGPEQAREANPWLQKTRWIPYFQEIDLRMVQPLVALPTADEPILIAIHSSLQRVIHQAQKSVLTERINIFDQTTVNMFRDHNTKAGQPLLVSLQQSTYHRYCQVWIRLLGFLHRIAAPEFDPSLRQQLKIQLQPEQQERYRYCCTLAQTGLNSTNNINPGTQLTLDQAVTSWSLSLLCHPLHGNQYESAIVSFLAILGLKDVGHPLERVRTNH